MNYIPAYPILIGQGTIPDNLRSLNPGAHSQIGNVYAVPIPGPRRYRFELHYAGRAVTRTTLYTVVWNAWRCEVPLKFCFDSKGATPQRSPLQQWEHERLQRAKDKSGYRCGDLVKRGSRYGIVQDVDIEKVALEHRVKLLIRECRLKPMTQGGRVPVTVDGVKMKASWLWTDPKRLVTVLGPQWVKIT
ncbi:MAG: hypothetical protein JWN75_1200 [Candidatus Saccharibacteria bacterium]|nr:hypothetical protein [Candidatus Saccharibacteria bacterium]